MAPIASAQEQLLAAPGALFIVITALGVLPFAFMTLTAFVQLHFREMTPRKQATDTTMLGPGADPALAYAESPCCHAPRSGTSTDGPTTLRTHPGA